MHPDVEDAATFPIPDAKFGSVIGCAVVLRGGATVRARDLKWFATTHLQSFKVPQRIVMVQSIPAAGRARMAESLGIAHRSQACSIFKMKGEGEGAPVYVIGAKEEPRFRSGRPLYGIVVPEISKLPPPRTIEHAAAECIHTIRTFQPDGPYALASPPASREIAIEIARQIELAGEPVEFVAIVAGEWEPRAFPGNRRRLWAGRTVDAAFVGIE